MSYWDIARVREDFIAVFTKAEDEENKDLWKTFIPHGKFEEFLKSVLDVLEREGHVWLYGPYGTGKTHASFVIKHLLEDRLENIEDYLENLKIDEREKVISVRNTSKPLVIYRDGASEVNTHEKFMYIVAREIENKLKEVGVNPGSVFETVREKLKERSIDWDRIAEKYYRSRFSSGEELLEWFTKDKVSVDDFGELMDILSKEGFNPPASNVEDIEKILDAMVSKTEYKRILFIWDEFTSFFNNLRPPVETLQRVVQNLRKPIHFILITHIPPENIRTTWEKESFEKLRDRFDYRIHYDMEPPTAIDMLGKVLQKLDEFKWKEHIQTVYTRGREKLEPLIEELFEYADKPYNIFEKIFPLHPYAVKALIDLTSNFGSQERSMFKFMSERYPEFLKTHPNDGWELLTADVVWDYFSPQLGKSNVWKFTNHLKNFEKILDEDSQRVLKIIALFQFFKENVSGFKASSVDEISKVFSETPLDGRISEIIEELRSKRAVVKLGKEYLIPSNFVDVEVEAKPEDIFEFKDFEERLRDIFFSKFTRGQNRLEERLEYSFERWENLKISRIPEPKGHKVGLLVTIPTNDMVSIQDVISKFEDIPEHTLVVVVQKSIGEIWDDLEDYVKYYKSAEKDRNYRISFDAKDEIFRILDREYQSETAYYYVFSKDMEKPILVPNSNDVIDQIEKIIEKRFPYGFDRYVKSDPLWKWETGKSCMEKVLKGMSLSRKYNELEELLRVVWRVVDRSWNIIDENCQDQIPICRMRKAIKKLFENRNEVSVGEIWSTLSNPPFGLYNSSLTYVILGVLMKEYLDHYYRDGVEEGPLNPNEMTKLFSDVVKEGKGGDKKFIKKLGEHQEYFIRFVEKVFIESDLKSLTKAVDTMRSRIKEIGYPIWLLKYHPEMGDKQKKVVDILAQISKEYSQKNQMEDEMKSLHNICKKDIPVNLEGIRDFILKRFKYEEALDGFLRSFDFEVGDPKKIFQRLVRKMQEEIPRWDEGKVKEIMKDVIRELDIAKKLCGIFGLNCRGTVFPEEVVSEFLKDFKYPIWLFRYHPKVRRNGGIEKLLDYMEKGKEENLDYVEKLDEGTRIFNDVGSALENFISSVLKDIESDMLNTLISKLEEKLSPTLSEISAKHLVKDIYGEISLENLKDKIRSEISNFLGEELENFLKKMKLSPYVLKDEKVRKDMETLLDMDRRTREDFEKIDLKSLLSFLKGLKEEDVVKMYREKLGIFEESVDQLEDEAVWDFVDSIPDNELLNLDEIKLMYRFQEWFKEYHETYVKPEIIDRIQSMNEIEIKELMKRLIDIPRMGLTIFKMMDEMERKG